MAALTAILLPSSLPAQIVFERTYGGGDVDYGNSVQQTTDGGFIVAGQTSSFGAGIYDFYLVKTDAHGDTQWTRTYGGTNFDYGWSARQTSDGGYIIVGETQSRGAGNVDVYLVKTDANGDTVATRTFGGTGYDYGYSVQQTADSGYVIAGVTSSFGSGVRDVYLVKTNAACNTLWTTTFGGANYEEGRSVQQTADGGYIIAGCTGSYGAGCYDFYLVKTDGNGGEMWTKTFGSYGWEYAQSVQQTTDGGYIVVGYTDYLGAGSYDIYLVKTDSNGDRLWARTFGSDTFDLGYSVQQTADGGYVMAGCTESFSSGYTDVYLIKTNADGDTLWTRKFGGTGSDAGYSVQQTADGGYVIAGSTESFGAGYGDVYLIKTDADGNVAVAEPKASPTRAPALCLTCAPNPASGSVTISLSPSIPLSLSPVLRIFDAQGRLVLSQPVRTSSFILHASSLSAGAYFIRCDVAGEYASARIVLQR